MQRGTAIGQAGGERNGHTDTHARYRGSTVGKVDSTCRTSDTSEVFAGLVVRLFVT